jgi:hypothetical protein
MKYLVFLLFLVCLSLGCGSAPANTNSAANGPAANAAPAEAKPSSLPPPSKEALLELDRLGNEAWAKGDAAYFENLLADNFVSYFGGKRGNKGDELRIIPENKCAIRSWNLDDPQMMIIDSDTAVVSYRSNIDGSCGDNILPSPLRAATVWVRRGDSWKSIYHNATPIVDPATFVPPPVKPATKPVEKPIPEKTINPNSPNDKRPPIVADQFTDLIAGLERQVWDAWKTRDAAKLGALISDSVMFVDGFGGYLGSKDAVLSSWLGPKCEVASVEISSPSVSLINPNVALMTFKGTAVGTCDGKRLFPFWETAIYRQEGSTWKLVFGFETPAS